MRADPGVRAHDDLAAEVAVAVAHAEREGRPVRALAHAHVRERRVPRDVDVAGEQGLDLPLVVAEEGEVQRARPTRGSARGCPPRW